MLAYDSLRVLLYEGLILSLFAYVICSLASLFSLLLAYLLIRFIWFIFLSGSLRHPSY